MINRRSFLAGTGSMAVAGLANWHPAHAGGVTFNMFASAAKNRQDDKHYAVILSDRGADRSFDRFHKVLLPGRAHEVVARPSHWKTYQCVALGRRPRRFAAIIDYDPMNGVERAARFIKTRKDRHFFGHGVFSPDGKLFYTTENDYEGERGVIGVRDATRNYQQIGELQSYGIGPHQIRITDKGKTLVVANGGILTHPDLPRQKLNLDIMQASLVYLDAKTGELREQHKLPQELYQLSIRHFDIAANGTVVFGCQHQGAKTQRPPLIGFHRRGQPLQLALAREKRHRRMRNYVGSVTIGTDGKFAAASCPRGNMITFWELQTGQYSSMMELPDGCGLAVEGGWASSPSPFIVSSGTGKLAMANMQTDAPTSLKTLIAAKHLPIIEGLKTFQWDNHLTHLGLMMIPKF